MDRPWVLIESDPKILKAITREHGVPGVDFLDVWNLTGLGEILFDHHFKVEEMIMQPELDAIMFETNALARFYPHIYGFLLCFECINTNEEPIPDATVEPKPDGMVFAVQRATNSCASMAAFHLGQNISSLRGLGSSEFDELLEITAAVDPQSAGEIINNCQLIADIHSRQTFDYSPTFNPRGIQNKESSEKLYHYSAIIPFEHAIYELDGRRDSVLRYGAYTENPDETVKSIIEALNNAIERKMNARPENQFSLLAAVADMSELAVFKLLDIREFLSKHSANGKAQELLKLTEVVAHRSPLREPSKVMHTENYDAIHEQLATHVQILLSVIEPPEIDIDLLIKRNNMFNFAIAALGGAAKVAASA